MIRFVDYKDESQMASVMELVGRDLSEPYSVFTYRYFLTRYPELCILAMNEKDEAIGCVVGKIDDEELLSVLADESVEPTVDKTGYIGMLAVSEHYRRRGIGKDLVRQILLRMQKLGCSSATLETEVSNVTAMKLYQKEFGFIREELLVRYYLNWSDAYRLRLWFSSPHKRAVYS